MKWFKHLVFLVFFVIVFSFVEIHEKRREVLLEKNSKVSYVVAYPRILRTICLFLFGVGVILFLYLSIMNIKYHGELEKGLFVFACICGIYTDADMENRSTRKSDGGE